MRSIVSSHNYTKHKLGDLVTCFSGGTPSRKRPEYYQGSIPWIKSGELNQKVIRDTEECISEEAVRASSVNYVKKMTLLYALYGATTGVVAFTLIEATINQAVLAIIPVKGLDKYYLYYWLQANRKRIVENLTQGGQANLSADILKKLEIYLPTLEVQRQIRKLIYCWDRAIDKIDKLILAKKAFKQALMQKLLTGQIRFRGFGKLVAKRGELPEGFKHVTLRDIANLAFSNVDKKTYEHQKNVKLCNYMDVYQNDFIDNSIEFMDSTATEQEIQRFSIQRGDILVTKDSETADDIGVPAYVVDDVSNFVCGYHLAIVRANSMEVYPLFLFFEMQSKIVTDQFSKLANGVTRFGLSISDFANISLSIPEYDEQIKIANLLKNACDEIKSLHKLRTDLVKQRQGLMNRLINNSLGEHNGKN